MEQDPPELFPQKRTRERILLFILVNNIDWGFRLEMGFVFHLFFFRHSSEATTHTHDGCRQEDLFFFRHSSEATTHTQDGWRQEEEV
jgi:hypothetical protein